MYSDNWFSSRMIDPSATLLLIHRRDQAEVPWCRLSWNVWGSSQPSLLFLSAGRCASCGENVVGEGTGCTAMDQVFHVDCFVCMTCSTKLRGKPFFAVEKKAYCEPCYIVSNFLPPLQPAHCLASAHFGCLCVHITKGHVMIWGAQSLSALRQECSHIFTSSNRS